jgi:type IV pilus assembly protein PilM
MSLFKGKKRVSVGIDVGTASVKIVELSQKDGRGIELTNYGEYNSSVGSVIKSNAAIISIGEISDITKQVLEEAKIKEINVSMAIPIMAGFTTLISLPSMSNEELEQAVIYEAKKYVPLPLSEVQFEWVKIGEGEKRKDSASKSDVLIVAVTNELVNKYHNIASISGLELKFLELDVFSLARSLIAPDDESTLIINMGAQTTALAIIERGWPVFTRTIEFSGLEFSKVLASSLGIDLARAEQMKIKEGINAGEGILHPLIDSILTEGDRMISDYFSKRKVSTKRVKLCGGSARMTGLIDYTKKHTDKEISIGNPFHDIIYPKVLSKTLEELAPGFDIAVGLALREFK